MKYVLGVQQSMPNYPTHQDFMFEVISYIIRVSESKEKSFDPKDIKFSAKTLKYVFGDKVKSEEFLSRIKSILTDLIDSNSLEKDGEFIYISEEEFFKYYTIS